MAPIDVYTMTAISIAMINFMKTIPACISPGTGKNGSTVAVSCHLGPVLLSSTSQRKFHLKHSRLLGSKGRVLTRLVFSGLQSSLYLRPTAYTAAKIKHLFYIWTSTNIWTGFQFR